MTETYYKEWLNSGWTINKFVKFKLQEQARQKDIDLKLRLNRVIKDNKEYYGYQIKQIIGKEMGLGLRK